MADQVTKSNLFSESRNNVVGIIKDNVSDPTISSAEYRKWIYSREPDVKDSDFAGYPYIVVHPSEVETLDEGKSVDGKSKFIAWIMMIDIVSSDRGYGSADGKGLSHSDTIGDSIISAFNNKTYRDTLSNNSMKFSEPTSAGSVVEPLHNELVYRRTIILPFRSKITVSS